MKNLSKKINYFMATALTLLNITASSCFADDFVHDVLGGVSSVVTSITGVGNTMPNASENAFQDIKVGAVSDVNSLADAAKTTEISDKKIATKVHGENLISVMSAEVSTELVVNEGPEAGRMFMKTATLKCVFKNPVSSEFPETADFLFKVTFKYDKKGFVGTDKDNVLCQCDTREDMDYNIVGNSEILPALPNQDVPIATVSSMYTIFKEVNGRKVTVECSHADLFCSVNGEIGYNAQQF